jgi:hypothetical protein
MGERLTADKVVALIGLLRTVEMCERAVVEYAQAELSGTPHDIEHRELLAVALQRFRGIVATHNGLKSEPSPEMIKAGVGAFYECDVRVDDAQSIVETIWHAMAAAKEDAC